MGAWSETERGMAFMVVAMLLVPGIDAFAKLLTATQSAGEIAWSRFLLQSILLAPWVLWRGSFRIEQPILQAARGVLIAGTTLFFFAALKFLPLAEAISIFFVEPLILTLLSAWLLGETVGWRRVTAVIIGLSGALLVIRPSFAAVGPAAVLPVLAAVSFALYLVLTRRLARGTDPFVMQLSAGLSGVLVMSLALACGEIWAIETLAWKPPSLADWILMAGLGVIATTGHLLVVRAFSLASASILAPFQYLEIISATLLGFLIFGDFPDAMTWLGVAVIVGSGLYVFHRERVHARS